MSIIVRTLGTQRVIVDGAEIASLPNQPTRWALLAYLAVAGRAPREDVMARLWPDRAPDRARRALNQTVYELRKDLGSDWVEAGGNLLMTAEDFECDAVDFEGLVRNGDDAAALAQYGGPFLHAARLPKSSDFAFWVDQQRAHLARLYRESMRRHLPILCEAGRHREALARAREWTLAEPLEEEAQLRLAELLARVEGADSARRHLEHFERFLRETFGDEPAQEFERILARIEAGDLSPAGSSIEPLPTGPSTSRPQDSSEPPVSRHSALLPLGTEPEKPSPTRRAPYRGLVAVLLVAIGMLGLWSAYPTPPEGASPSELRRVAVLHFDDRTEDRSARHVATALTEQLIRELSGVEALGVVSGNGILPFRDSATSLGELKEALDVGAVVTGGISRRDGQWSIAFDIADASTGELLESGVVRADEATAGLTRDVAVAVASRLRRALGREIRLREWEDGTSDPVAWEAFARGLDLSTDLAEMARKQEYERPRLSFEMADSLLAVARDRDPTWLAPWILAAELARDRAVIELSAWQRRRAAGDSTSPGESEAWARQGLAYADSARRLNPASAAALAAQGKLRHFLANLPGVSEREARQYRHQARQALEGATGRDPTLARAWVELSEIYLASRRLAEASYAARRAHEADAWLESQDAVEYRAYEAAFELRQDSLAKDACDRGRTRYGSNPMFTYCALELLAWADGISPDPAYARRIYEEAPPQALQSQPELTGRLRMMIASVEARAGRFDRAVALIDSVKAADVGGDPSLLWYEAAARAMMGDPGKAVDLLGRYQNVDPASARRVFQKRPFYRLRETREFAALLESPRDVTAGELGG